MVEKPFLPSPTARPAAAAYENCVNELNGSDSEFDAMPVQLHVLVLDSENLRLKEVHKGCLCFIIVQSLCP
jgi:hypothetical protein